MGKPEDDEYSLSSAAGGGTEGRASGSNAGRRECSRVCRCISFKCLFVLLLGISVFLSAIFWLPPFLKLQDRDDPDLDPRFRGHTIVASFTLPKHVSIVEDNVQDLESDIYYEIEAANTKVTILSLESSTGRNGSNETHVVFAVDPVSKHSKISPAEQSLIRADFEYLVTGQTDFGVTTSLFGKPYFFDVLKFPGGITISPPQNAFPLQSVQISFNFTLNNSIHQIQDNFQDLKYQLKSGLHLTGNEILYIRLTNSRGSTVAPPATVQTSVVLRVGVPSVPRMKQLAQTIRHSPENLGLNNSVFGKVKQISLSSVLPRSPSGDGSSPAPAPSPLAHGHHHHHHHHHHHDHDHDGRHQGGHSAYLPPAGAPSYSPLEAPRPPRPVKGAMPPQRSAPPHLRSHRAAPHGAPSPVKSYEANPPAAPPSVRSHHRASAPGCQYGFKHRHISVSPAQPPTRVPHHSAVAPRPRPKSPTPVAHRISPSSPLPNVIYARVPPPVGPETNPKPPDKMPLIAPSQSAVGRISTVHLTLIPLLALLVLELW